MIPAWLVWGGEMTVREWLAREALITRAEVIQLKDCIVLPTTVVRLPVMRRTLIATVVQGMWPR